MSKPLADRVIRRAIELHSAQEHGPATMSRASIDQVAAELGVSPEFVDRAIAEELQTATSGALTPMERIFAPRMMRGGTVVHAPAATVQRDIVAWLTAQEGLRPRSKSRGGIQWERDDHWTTKLSLGLGTDGNKALRGMRRVTHHQTEVGEDAHLVEIEVDSSIISKVGVGLLAGFGALGVFNGTFLAVGVADTGAMADIVQFIAGLGGTTAVGLAAGMITARVWASNVRDGLERALDGIAHPELFKRHSRRRSRRNKRTGFIDRVEDVLDEFKDILD